MRIEDHGAHTVYNDISREHCNAIKELIDDSRLGTRSTKYDEWCVVNCPGILEQGTNDALDVLGTSSIEPGLVFATGASWWLAL